MTGFVIMFSDEMTHEVGDFATHRSLGVVETTVGTEAVVPLTGQMALVVDASLAPRKTGASVAPAANGGDEYVTLIVGVPPPNIESETLWCIVS